MRVQGVVARVPTISIVYHPGMDVKGEQVRRLEATIGWARKIRAHLQPLLDAHGDRVHFRPSSAGIAMIGLLHERPQRGKSGITNVERVVATFEEMFATHCQKVLQGRPTGEKALQSFLIRESYRSGRRMMPVNIASTSTNEPVDLVFVTDEIPLPIEGGKIVCDVLALRRDAGRCTPVLLELKDDRMLARLVEQVEGYSSLMDEHASLFADLFGALLGEAIRFDGPTERWIVWPAAGATQDPREGELAAKRIRVLGYTQEDGAYKFRSGGGRFG